MGQIRARMETESHRLTHVFQPGSHVRRAKGLVLCAPSGHTQSTWWEQQDGESLPRERCFYQQSSNFLVASRIRKLPMKQG